MKKYNSGVMGPCVNVINLPVRKFVYGSRSKLFDRPEIHRLKRDMKMVVLLKGMQT